MENCPLATAGATLEGRDEFARQRGARDLKPFQLPMLVTFADVADPKTVEQVDPENPGAALGCDFKWQRMTIEVTDEPITTEIEERLGWLADGEARAQLNRDWPHLSAEQHDILSNDNWQRGTRK